MNKLFVVLISPAFTRIVRNKDIDLSLYYDVEGMTPLSEIHDIFTSIVELEIKFLGNELKVFSPEVTELFFEESNFLENGDNQVKNVLFIPVIWWLFKSFY